MANWLNRCSFARPARPTNRSPLKQSLRPEPPPLPLRREGFHPARIGAARIFLLAIVAAAGCGHAGTSPSAQAPPADAGPTSPEPQRLDDSGAALCRPADFGSLQARLQGAIDAEIGWSAPGTPQCLGGPRPDGGGLRLLYKGALPEGQSLVIVVGIAQPARAGAARNVPANVTIIREGTGVFYATQGQDKCALDEVSLEPIDGPAGRYRLAGRGYCTQPARAVGADAGVVLMSRFDVAALVDAPVGP